MEQIRKTIDRIGQVTNTRTLESLLKNCDKCGEPLFYQLEILGKKKIVPRMCSCRKEEAERQRIAEENFQKQERLNRLKDYSMMDSHFEQCTFDNFVIDKRNRKFYNLGIKYCDRWHEMKRKNLGFLFHGSPGTGKTFLSFCIANKLLEEMVPVIAISSLGILNRIKQTYNSYGREGEVEIINSLKNASLLVLDDLGAENDTQWAKEKMYEIIDSRVRNEKPMICTSNLTKEQLKTKLTSNDGVIRTYDRLIEMCYPIEISGPSKRANKAREKEEVLRELLG